MLEQTFGEISLRQGLTALAILVVFTGLALLVRLFLTRTLSRLVKKTKTKLDDAMIKAIRKPLIALIIAAGLYLAVLPFHEATNVWSYITRGLATALSLLGIFFVVVLLDNLIKWYQQLVFTKKKEVGFNTRLLRFCFVALILIAIWVAVIASFAIWGLPVTLVTSWLGEHGWRIALIVAISVVAIISTGELVPRIMLQTMMHRPGETSGEAKKRSKTLSGVISSAIQIFIAIIAVFMILSDLNIDIGPLLAGAGVAGIAIGFGAQSLVKDVLAGLFVIIENQYCVGDVAKIADVIGIVEEINLRRTVLRDLDGIVHVVPNGEIRVASNYTKEWSRVNLNISVAYGQDLDRVIPVINKVGQELAEDPKWAPLILKAPQALRVDKLGDSGIEIKILGDTKPIQQWTVMGELRLRLKKAFDEEGIEIPWPHTKVYFGNAPDGLGPEQDSALKGKT